MYLEGQTKQQTGNRCPFTAEWEVDQSMCVVCVCHFPQGSCAAFMSALVAVWLPVAPGSCPLHLTPGVPHPHQLLWPTPEVHLKNKIQKYMFLSSVFHIIFILLSFHVKDMMVPP